MIRSWIFRFFIFFFFVATLIISPNLFSIKRDIEHYKIELNYVTKPTDEILREVLTPLEERISKLDSLSFMESSLSSSKINIFFSLTGKRIENDYHSIRRFLIRFSANLPESFSRPTILKNHHYQRTHFLFVTTNNIDWTEQLKSVAELTKSGESSTKVNITIHKRLALENQLSFENTAMLIQNFKKNDYIGKIENQTTRIPIYFSSSPISIGKNHAIKEILQDNISIEETIEKDNSAIFINEKEATMVSLKLREGSNQKTDIKQIRKKMRADKNNILIYDHFANETVKLLKKVFLSLGIFTIIIFAYLLILIKFMKKDFHFPLSTFILFILIWSPLFFSNIENNFLYLPILWLISSSLFLVANKIISVVFQLIATLFFYFLLYRLDNNINALQMYLTLSLPILFALFQDQIKLKRILICRMKTIRFFLALLVLLAMTTIILLPFYFYKENKLELKSFTLYFKNNLSLETTLANTRESLPFIKKELNLSTKSTLITQVDSSKVIFYYQNISPKKIIALTTRLSSYYSLTAIENKGRNKETQLIISHPEAKMLPHAQLIINKLREKLKLPPILTSFSDENAITIHPMLASSQLAILKKRDEEALYQYASHYIDEIIHNNERVHIRLKNLSSNDSFEYSGPHEIKNQIKQHARFNTLPALKLTFDPSEREFSNLLVEKLKEVDPLFAIEQSPSNNRELITSPLNLFIINNLYISIYLFLNLLLLIGKKRGKLDYEQ